MCAVVYLYIPMFISFRISEKSRYKNKGVWLKKCLTTQDIRGRLSDVNVMLDTDRTVLLSLLSDYGLQMYRRDDGGEPASTYQQRLMEVYMPPEFHNSNIEPSLAGDVFR